MKILLDHGVLHGDALTITGKTIAEVLSSVPAEPRKDQNVIHARNSPVYAQGHLTILKGNLATEGAVAKISGTKMKKITGTSPRLQFEEESLAAILAHKINPGDIPGNPLRRSKGGPGMREMLSPTSALIGAGLGDSVGLIHGWPLLRWHLRSGGRPRSPGSSSRRRHSACIKEGDSITIDADSRVLQLNVSAEEFEKRRAQWKPPEPRYRAGVLAKYVRQVSSSSIGAITDAA